MIRPYLELARISNLPTVWTNTLVGLYAGYTASAITHPLWLSPPADWRLLLSLLLFGLPMLLGLSALYCGGMVLNDVLDESIDREEGRDRPIPAGRVSAAAARRFVVVLFLVGVFAISLYGSMPATILVLLLGLTIVAYDRYHTRTVWTVGLMGLTRGLVYLTAASVFAADAGVWARVVLPFAAIAGIYTTLLSIVARREAIAPSRARRWIAPALAILPLLAALFVAPSAWIWTAAAAAVLLLWLTRSGRHALAEPPRIGPAITGWIAGMALMDAFFLTLLGQPLAAGVAGVLFGVTVWGQRRIRGT